MLTQTQTQTQTYVIDKEMNQNLLSTENEPHIVLGSLNFIILNNYLLGMYQIFHMHFI